MEIGGRALDNAGDLQRLMISDAIGHRQPLRVVRNDDVLELSVVPAELEE